MYVARPELGLKHVCTACAVRFYDLNRVPAHCPACGAVPPPPRPRSTAASRATGTRWTTRPAPAAVADPVEAADDDAIPLLDPADPDEEEDADDTAEVVVPDEDT